MYHFLVTRVFIVLLSVICAYAANANHSRLAKVLSVLLSLIALVQLIYGIGSVINLYEDVYEHLKNIHGVLKAILLKVSVALITIQGIVLGFLIELGGNPYKDNDKYSAEDRLQRYYCALVLIEFTVVSVVYLYAFRKEVALPATPYTKYIISKGGIGCKIKPTFCWFLSQVFNFSDVFGVLALVDENDVHPVSGTELT